MINSLGQLWRGELPLPQAFWRFGVVYGLAVNLAMSALALLTHVVFGSIVLTGIVHFAAVPFNMLTFVGVWRSAAGHTGPSWQADLAKSAIVAVFLALLIV